MILIYLENITFSSWEISKMLMYNQYLLAFFSSDAIRYILRDAVIKCINSIDFYGRLLFIIHLAIIWDLFYFT